MRAATSTSTASPARSSSPATVSRCEASYGLLQFGADNRIDNAVTEYIPASAPADADVAAGAGRGRPRR